MTNRFRIGIDVGSTTIKAIVLNDRDEIVYRKYERHFSMIAEKTTELLSAIIAELGDAQAGLAISGSAGMGLADKYGISFIQEVYATRVAVEALLPCADTVIELGGEDAKILFLTARHGETVYEDLEVRMNGTCAGGTGAFIDQMATLLDVTPGEMNELAKSHEKIYTIASRCGVFAKSDIQPLLNQGAQKSDIAASIFSAVVNQTVAGLAQGRKIEGAVIYLGGPLSYLSELRESFDKTLDVKGINPENSLYYAAYGSAKCADKAMRLSDVVREVKAGQAAGGYRSSRRLFADAAEYEAFRARHSKAFVPETGDHGYAGDAYIGIDAGSTTVKATLIDENEEIIYSEYLPSSGNPVKIAKAFLERVYEQFPGAVIKGAASTGYGEEMIKNAFCLDFSLVETMAHFYAAQKFQPEVDFVIDIGGQDIKCFKIRGGAIDNIFLNEACSSGCGSFLQTFAEALGHGIADFAKLGILADRPVDLGSRCTVFMNSSVKQSQKDGASIENISAGLSISVVKNALYKVIRAASANDLGEHIVVQGGTFLNDAVLRAFEQEIGHDVVRPNIAGLMGAYGAALYAKRKSHGESSILNRDALGGFMHEVKNITCGGCANRCALTVNNFGSGRRFIGGNRCEKPLAKQSDTGKYNIYEFKRELLESYAGKPGPRGKIGIPMGLNLFELFPFWFTFFTRLGFEVVHSPASSRELYLLGQSTISSDTACYPAKLMHGHIQALIDAGVETIFYPCMSYNLDEGGSDNHYNCPVVAYYPEVIRANMPSVRDVNFVYTYLGIHNKVNFISRMRTILDSDLGCGKIPLKAVSEATDAAYAAYNGYMEKVRRCGDAYLEAAKKENLPVIVLAGRPYHIDPEINHGIDQLICGLGAVVVSEDAVSGKIPGSPVNVLNQWTYHSRLYSAAKFVAQSQDADLNLVQLISFGCGVDAVTSDEVRSILEAGGKIYTQIKIDEITNLGAVKIRLRSLFEALGNVRSENEKRSD